MSHVGEVPTNCAGLVSRQLLQLGFEDAGSGEAALQVALEQGEKAVQACEEGSEVGVALHVRGVAGSHRGRVKA
jgi:hypothetical protein